MDVVAPVASRVADLPVEVGEQVAGGQTLAILEVMKMERLVLDHKPGVVTSLKVSIGQGSNNRSVRV